MSFHACSGSFKLKSMRQGLFSAEHLKWKSGMNLQVLASDTLLMKHCMWYVALLRPGSLVSSRSWTVVGSAVIACLIVAYAVWESCPVASLSHRTFHSLFIADDLNASPLHLQGCRSVWGWTFKEQPLSSMDDYLPLPLCFKGKHPQLDDPTSLHPWCAVGVVTNLNGCQSYVRFIDC